MTCFFLLISQRNDSAVSYELSAPRFAVESRRRMRRGLQYEKTVFSPAELRAGDGGAIGRGAAGVHLR